MRIIKGFLKICLWVVVSICVLFVTMVILSVANRPSDKPTVAQLPSSTPATPAPPTAIPMPTAAITTPDALYQAIMVNIEPRNRADVPLMQVKVYTGTLIIWWPLNDASDFKKNTLQETVQILQTIHCSDVEYNTVSLFGTTRMIDVYGNEDESRVFWITLYRGDVDKINWGNSDFVASTLYKTLADITPYMGFDDYFNDK